MPVTYIDWLTFPEQSLVEVTSGWLFHDELKVEKLRKKFLYFPNEVWKYLYWAQWDRIAHDEAFVGRSADVADVLGHELLVARIMNHIINMAFLMRRKYKPYWKWRGTAF